MQRDISDGPQSGIMLEVKDGGMKAGRNLSTGWILVATKFGLRLSWAGLVRPAQALLFIKLVLVLLGFQEHGGQIAQTKYAAIG